jgi:kojibiose phosphorylase
MGYRGALYAWESADSGEETTPEYVLGLDGRLIRILCGIQEQHISADVAYAVWHYWQATADVGFLLEAGAEILLETARFWASRAEPDPDGAYHVRDVIGPDEHHERVDDSAYTNMLARFNLEIGQRTADWLQEEHPARWRALSARLRLGEAEVTQWGQVGDRLVLRHDPSTWLIEEFAGYFDLEPIDLARFGSKVGRLEHVLGRAGLARTQIIKQPDVVLLCYLLWNRFGAAVARRNFAYYAPRCEAASSLSPSIHALVAARLGRLRAAERYLRQAAELDLDNRFEEPAEGIHIGNCGGVWQAVVFGLAGLRPAPTGLTFAPRLPATWRSLRFPLHFRGRRLRTEVSGEALSVQLEVGEPLRLRLLGGPATTLAAGQRGTTRCADGRWQAWDIRRRRA